MKSEVFEASVTVFEASAAALDASIDALDASIDALDASIDALDASIAALDASIDALDASIDALDASIAAVGTRLALRADCDDSVYGDFHVQVAVCHQRQHLASIQALQSTNTRAVGRLDGEMNPLDVFFKIVATFTGAGIVLISEHHDTATIRPHKSAMNDMTRQDESRQSDAERLLALLEPVHERARMTARRLCRSQAEGDDLFQDAAIRAMNQISKLRDDKAFPAWFHRILFSLHRNRTRVHFWRRLLPLDAVMGNGHEPAGDDGSAWEEQRQGARRMRDALNKLPAVQREAVVLFDIDGYSLQEVAAMQAVSLSAVKSRLTRGRARLRRHYQRAGYVDSVNAESAAWTPDANMAEKRNPS